MELDRDDEDLRELVKKTLALTQENNRMLRGMRSSVRWGRFFTLLWWGVILASTGVAYYYLQPYIEQAQQIYMQAREANHQAENYGAQFADFLNQLKETQRQ